MSGGGIRSGAVSLGAIQGIFASHALLNYEFISTVSGGGYPVYGLLDRMLRDEIALRTLLRERSKYIRDVDRQAAFLGRALRSLAVVTEPTISVAMSWLSRAYGSAQPIYISNIHLSFTGVARPFFGEQLLQNARDVRRYGFPVPIFGTSASIGPGQPRDDYDYHFEDFFELSPAGSGAPRVGYFQSLGAEITLSQAVAISAAAIDAPPGNSQLPEIFKVLNIGLGGNFNARGKDGNIVRFYLADGGFTENLGLLPLLRRRCTEILAFDNSDEHPHPFQAWIKFSTRLATEEKGWSVRSELRSATGDPVPAQADAGWHLPHHIWDAQLEHESGSRVHVRLVKLGVSPQAFANYPPAVRRFAEKTWAREEKQTCRGAGLSRRCSFPLEATVRQSFRTDEFRAYRLLGSWLATQALQTDPPTFDPR